MTLPKHPSVRVRRNDPKKDFRTLPKAGRKGKRTPKWPIAEDIQIQSQIEASLARIGRHEQYRASVSATNNRERLRVTREIDRLNDLVAELRTKQEMFVEEEASLWEQLWQMPQALIWEETGSIREVAQYVRWKVRAEQGDGQASGRAMALSDRLGLNPLAMMRLRIEIEHAGAAVEKTQRRAAAAAPPPPSEKGDPDDPRGGLYAVS